MAAAGVAEELHAHEPAALLRSAVIRASPAAMAEITQVPWFWHQYGDASLGLAFQAQHTENRINMYLVLWILIFGFTVAEGIVYVMEPDLYDYAMHPFASAAISLFFLVAMVIARHRLAGMHRTVQICNEVPRYSSIKHSLIPLRC